jgi:CRISPR-associated endonuclease Csn1
MSEEEIQSSIVDGTYHKISENLYRVQKITAGDYFFRHHLETRLEKDNKEAKLFTEMGKFKRISSLSAFKKENPIKVRVDAKGSIQIVEKR